MFASPTMPPQCNLLLIARTHRHIHNHTNIPTVIIKLLFVIIIIILIIINTIKKNNQQQLLQGPGTDADADTGSQQKQQQQQQLHQSIEESRGYECPVTCTTRIFE